MEICLDHLCAIDVYHCWNWFEPLSTQLITKFPFDLISLSRFSIWDTEWMGRGAKWNRLQHSSVTEVRDFQFDIVRIFTPFPNNRFRSITFNFIEHESLMNSHWILEQVKLHFAYTVIVILWKICWKIVSFSVYRKFSIEMASCLFVAHKYMCIDLKLC